MKITVIHKWGAEENINLETDLEFYSVPNNCCLIFQSSTRQMLVSVRQFHSRVIRTGIYFTNRNRSLSIVIFIERPIRWRGQLKVEGAARIILYAVVTASQSYKRFPACEEGLKGGNLVTELSLKDREGVRFHKAEVRILLAIVAMFCCPEWEGVWCGDYFLRRELAATISQESFILRSPFHTCAITRFVHTLALH